MACVFRVTNARIPNVLSGEHFKTLKKSHTGRRMCPMRLFSSVFRRKTMIEVASRQPLSLEGLENRQLMSAAYYAGTGLLSVTGTSGSDKIIVTSNATTGKTTVTTN